MVETVELIQRMDLTDLIYNYILSVVSESVRLEGKIRKFIREKQK